MEVSHFERNRLETLRRPRVFDTPSQTGFDRLTQLAARIFRVPLSGIMFVDNDRWVKASFGADAGEIDPENSLCSFVAQRDQPLVIEDTREEPRFAAHASVQGAPYVRFFAGVPIRSREGRCLGTFSIADRMPRRFAEADLHVLASLAEQVQEEMELRHERDKYRILFAGNPNPMWIYDPATLAFLEVNDAAVAKYGYTHEEFLRMRLTDIRPLEDVPLLMGEVTNLAPSAVRSRQMRHMTKDGTLLYVDVTGSAVEFEGKSARLVIALDVTERVQAELARKAAESRFRMLAENAVTAVYIFQNGRFVYANPRTAELTGYTQEEVGKVPVLKMIYEEDRALVAENIRRRLEGDVQELHYEFRIARKDGQIRHVETHGRSIEHEGRPAILGAIIDVTDRVLAETALKQSEATFRALVHNSAEVITLLKPDGTILYQSPSIQQILGYDPQELVGKNVFDYVHPDDVTMLLTKREDLLSSGSDLSGGYRFRARDGSWRWLETTASDATHDPAVGALVTTSRDVTERRRAEEDLRKSRAQYERLVNHLDGIVWEGVIDVQTMDVTFTFVSDQLRSVLGYEPESWMENASRWVEAIHDDDRTAVLERCEAEVPTGRDHTLEYRAIAADGRVVWLRDSVTVVDLSNGVATIAGQMTNVTQSKLAQDELRDREELLRLATHAGELGVWNWDVATGQLHWDSGTASMFGLPDAEEYERSAWHDFLKAIHEQDRPHVMQVVREALETCSSYATEYRLRLVDGSLRWTSVRGRVYADEHGEPQRVVGVVQDITKRKEAEQAVQESEELLRLATEAAEIGTWDLNVSSGAMRLSTSTARIFGDEPGTGRDTWDAFLSDVLPEDRSNLLRALQETLETMQRFETTFRIAHPDGEHHWIEARGSVYKDASGQPERLAGIIRDITRQKATEQALRESEERLRLATEAGGVGTFDVDIERAAGNWSPRSKEIMGIESDGPVAFDDFLRLIHPDDLHLAYESMARALDPTGPGIMDVEHRIVRPDGDVRWVATRASLAFEERDGHVRPVRLIGTVIDTTERKEAEAILIQAKQKAEEMARLKDTFLANMSHEIRTPLTSIIGFSEVLADDYSGEENEIIRMINASGKRLLDTLNSVLDLAQIESDSLQLRPESADVNEAVGLAMDIFAQQAAQKGVPFTFVPSVNEVSAWADYGALGRILNNLISNALKFTEEGRVEIETGREGTSVWIRVTDTGIGIDPQFLPHLFQEFRQESDGLSRSHEGSGLGLTITRRLVELMSGTIDVQSEKGRGSTFTVRLPASTPAAPVEVRNDGPANGASGMPRVLAVEDQEPIQVLLGHFLRNRCDLTSALTADQALAYTRSERFDAILVDIDLGEERTGIDLLHELRQQDHLAGVPIIACTAYGLPGDREKLLDAGFDGYIAKPFRKRDVLEALTGALEHVEL